MRNNHVANETRSREEFFFDAVSFFNDNEMKDIRLRSEKKSGPRLDTGTLQNEK